VGHLTLVEDANGTPLSAVVTCESNASGYYLLAFNLPEALPANANRLALWRAIVSCKDRGVRWFLLGSLDEGNGKAAAISRFKQQFGGVVRPAPVLEWPLRPGLDAALRLAERWARGARQLVSRVTPRAGGTP
jgi:lipid II:glycine glycyltransferase (peptidoglycan interpeptide bridge formation enzyme)